MTEREADRVRIANMTLAGDSQYNIAEALGISRSQVAYDAVLIRERWKASTTMDLDEAKGTELAKIDALERVYWDAWSLQCEPKQFQTKQGALITLAQTGDPQLLAGILKCIDRRCKLLGLDAPIQLKGEFKQFTITFDTPNGPRSEEALEALSTVVPHIDGKVTTAIRIPSHVR